MKIRVNKFVKRDLIAVYFSFYVSGLAYEHLTETFLFCISTQALINTAGEEFAAQTDKCFQLMKKEYFLVA